MEEGLKYLAAGLCMGLGALGPALGEGKIVTKTVETIGRNPEMSDKLFTTMIVGCAITESTGIYSLVISLIILFAA